MGTERTISLFARGGAVGIGTLADTGEMLFAELPRMRTHRNADKSGYRWYNDYRLPDHLGTGTITVRLHGNADDERQRFNRTENVRPIPPTDPDFARLYRRRNDAESINRALDDTLWLRRAHSIGHERQHLNLLTHALVVNSIALHRHRQRSSERRSLSPPDPPPWPSQAASARLEPPTEPRSSRTTLSGRHRTRTMTGNVSGPRTAGGFLPRSLPAPPG